MKICRNIYNCMETNWKIYQKVYMVRQEGRYINTLQITTWEACNVSVAPPSLFFTSENYVGRSKEVRRDLERPKHMCWIICVNLWRSLTGKIFVALPINIRVSLYRRRRGAVMVIIVVVGVGGAPSFRRGTDAQTDRTLFWRVAKSEQTEGEHVRRKGLPDAITEIAPPGPIEP